MTITSFAQQLPFEQSFWLIRYPSGTKMVVQLVEAHM